MTNHMNLTFDEKWEIILACDRSYDGLFYHSCRKTPCFSYGDIRNFALYPR